MARRVTVPKTSGVAGGRTVVLFGPQWFKLLHVAPLAPGRVLSKILAVSIAGMDDAQVLEAVRPAAHSAGFAMANVWIATASQFTTLRLLSLPSSDPKEIRDMIDLQIEKNTPHAKEEILSDSTLVETDPNGYSRMALAIVHRDVVSCSVKMAEALGWRVAGVVCEADGLAQWQKMVRPQEAASAAAALVADIDTDATTVAVLSRGNLYFHRSMALGMVQMASDASQGAVDSFIQELQRSAEAFEAEGMNMPPQTVLVTGLAHSPLDLAAKIQRALNLPVQVVPVFERCPATKPATSMALQVSTQTSFASLAGLGFASGRLDLTPPSVKLRHAFEKRAQALLGLGSRAVVLLLLVCLLAFVKTYQLQRYHDRMVQEHAVMDLPARDIAQTLDKLSVVQSRMRKRGYVLEAMEHISRWVPGSIRLTSFGYSTGEPIVLKGTSRELPQVYEFVSVLGKEPLFKKVEARRVSKRKVEGQDVTDFEVVCTLAEEKAIP
ncbi:MAG: pilus assembly protein PilM [Candidatus Omnitrophica bacterium]|nr:pilus assembly protein PilM [Candidatus Omnitrophota bacterium]